METFGLVMLIIIATTLQHLSQIFIRMSNKNNGFPTLFFALMSFMISIALYLTALDWVAENY